MTLKDAITDTSEDLFQSVEKCAYELAPPHVGKEVRFIHFLRSLVVLPILLIECRKFLGNQCWSRKNAANKRVQLCVNIYVDRDNWVNQAAQRFGKGYICYRISCKWDTWYDYCI